MMLAAVERHPEIHVVTHLNDGHTLNRYEPENAFLYCLHLGNADPEIEFTEEWRADDYTAEQWERHFKRQEEDQNREWSTEEVAAVHWILRHG